ncbi:DNA-methyltransferase [Anoxybacillus sp. D401a]|uniref:DNA-methyltransferase n=1 Tax=Anoxybacillus sp. D401a TaxID=575112 RepID=UPI003D349D6F
MNYLEYSIDYDIDNDILELTEKINNLFSKNDFYLQVDDEKTVKLYLNKIDMKKFNEFIENEKTAKTFLLKLKNTIEGNRSYGIASGKRIFVNYNAEVKVKEKEKKKKSRKQFFYVNEKGFSKECNQLPEQYVNQIICDDCEVFLKKLPDNCIDLIVTSPPYNFGMDYNEHDDTVFWKDYFSKMERILKECVRVLVWGGRIVFNIQPLFSDYIPTHHIFSRIFIDLGLIWRNEIIWEKNNYNAKFTSWGSWLSPSSPYFKYTWEFIEVFSKGEIKKTNRWGTESDLTPEEFKTWTIGKWSIAPERKMKEYGHPAMFPEELARRAIKLFSFPGDIVLDPFNGVGTTTYVADQLNRKYLGIDISSEYCETAKKRIIGGKNLFSLL